MLTLGVLLEGLTGETCAGWDQVITDAAIDSRLVIPGSLFVALAGERADGHDFIGEAFARGAIVALVERDTPPDWTVFDLRSGLPALPAQPPLPMCLASSALPGGPAGRRQPLALASQGEGGRDHGQRGEVDHQGAGGGRPR